MSKFMTQNEPDVTKVKVMQAEKTIGFLDRVGKRCSKSGLALLASGGAAGCFMIVANVLAASATPLGAVMAVAFPPVAAVLATSAIVGTAIGGMSLMTAGEKMQNKSFRMWEGVNQKYDSPVISQVRLENAEKTVGILEKKENRCTKTACANATFSAIGLAAAAVGFAASLPIVMPALAVAACTALMTVGAHKLGNHYMEKKRDEHHKINRLSAYLSGPGKPR